MMMSRWIGPVALAALLALDLACASAPKNPNGLAGTTDILALMRDWRGVWSGGVLDSPIGPLSYTLYIDRRPEMIHLRMADAGEGDLADLRNEFALLNFERGTPRIRALLTMRGKTAIQDLVYRPERSSQSSASFCLEAKGCVFTELIFTRIGKARVAIRAMVEEAPFAEIEVRFLEREIPESGIEAERARLTSTPQGSRQEGDRDAESAAQDGEVEGDLFEADALAADE